MASTCVRSTAVARSWWLAGCGESCDLLRGPWLAFGAVCPVQVASVLLMSALVVCFLAVGRIGSMLSGCWVLLVRWIKLSEMSCDAQLSSSWKSDRGGVELGHLVSMALVESAGWTERVRLVGMLRSLLWSVRS